MDNQEKDFLDDMDVKPKKQLSDQKLQQLTPSKYKSKSIRKEKGNERNIRQSKQIKTT